MASADPIRFNSDRLADVLPRGGRTLVLGCAGESRLLADAVMRAGPDVGAMTFTGIFVPGLNRCTYLANPDCHVETFFLTPELKAAGPAVTFLPLCYGDILAHLRRVRIDAALFTVSPPDGDGFCSFGATVDFLAELWPQIPVRIAHINPAMPRTPGHGGIPFSALSAFVEQDAPLPGMTDEGVDPVAVAIAGHVAPFVRDGATLQTGLGKVPGALLRALVGKRNLRLHSGLIGDAVLDLVEAGALAPGAAVTAGCAIGSDKLYAEISGPAFDFRPVSVTHDPHRIGVIENFVSINSAIEVDLFGQAYAEAGPKGLMSGPGGASDYARATWLGGGLRIVALAASAARGTISRIVPPGAGSGPVSLSRMDIDIVVTEHGIADLRAMTHDARAAALIAIAASDHQDRLVRAWQSATQNL